MVEEIIAFNKQFVESKGYEKYITNKYPDKKLAILSCMDTRLTELLPAALGLRNGDAKIIKNAGAVISHPFGSVIRSLLVAIYELGVEDIMVIAHSDCGAHHMDSNEILERMKTRGIREDLIEMIRFCGVDYTSSFDTVRCTCSWFYYRLTDRRTNAGCIKKGRALSPAFIFLRLYTFFDWCTRL